MIFFNLKEKKENGFTLIELLVVVAIIGILSSIVLASLNTATTKAKYAKAKMEMTQFVQAATIAQGESGKTFYEITGDYCTECYCRELGDVRNIPSSTGCYKRWAGVDGILIKVQNLTNGTVSGIDQMTRDPWGSPYGLDENEGETYPCVHDIITSAGPDGIFLNEDDQRYIIPFISKQCQ